MMNKPEQSDAGEAATLEPTFERQPPISIAIDGGKAPAVPILAEPSKDYGVGVSRVCLGGATFMRGTPDQHVVWIQHSGTVSAITWLAGRRIEHSPGPRSISINPAGCDNACEIGGPSEAMFIRVSPECAGLAAAQLGAHGGTPVADLTRRDDALHRIGRTLETEAARGHPNGMLFWSTVANAFIRRLVTHHLDEPTISHWGALDRRSLARLDAYIEDNIAEPLDLDTLAAVAGCGRFHFARCFRAATNVSPHRYVVRRRLDRARIMLRAGRASLAEIAATTGFTDQSHMSHWVRRVYATTPTQLAGTR